MHFLSLFESSTTKKLITLVSEFQRANPYPDYGDLYWNEAEGRVLYNVGDGQEGDLSELESKLAAVPGVKHAEVECECGRPNGSKQIWSQREL